MKDPERSLSASSGSGNMSLCHTASPTGLSSQYLDQGHVARRLPLLLVVSIASSCPAAAFVQSLRQGDFVVHDVTDQTPTDRLVEQLAHVCELPDNVVALLSATANATTDTPPDVSAKIPEDYQSGPGPCPYPYCDSQVYDDHVDWVKQCCKQFPSKKLSEMPSPSGRY